VSDLVSEPADVSKSSCQPVKKRYSKVSQNMDASLLLQAFEKIECLLRSSSIMDYGV
jgi:hypothetical protein